eukprot:1528488-Rhodomonas_salina.1
MSGTAIACAAISLRACYAMSGIDVAYHQCGYLPTRVLCDVRCCHSSCGYPGICLRACYAMSGTDMVYDARADASPVSELWRRGRDPPITPT